MEVTEWAIKKGRNYNWKRNGKENNKLEGKLKNKIETGRYW